MKDFKDVIIKAQNKDEKAKELLVKENLSLVWSLVHRFNSMMYEKEELFQIGCVGLIKAIDKFDVSYDVAFSTYAVPIILGEIKKYFRDSSLVKVSRNIKDLYYKIEEEKKVYFSEYNQDISIEELERRLNVDKYDLLIAMDSNNLPISLEKEYQNKDSSYTLQDTISDNKKDNLIDLLTLNDCLKNLTEKEKLLIRLRYYNDLSQREVADKFNVSQVQISRLEKHIIEKLRNYF